MNLGHLYVISAPSGTGKTSLVKALIEKDPSIRLSVSTTTREPRAGEVHGIDYFFVKKEDFDRCSKLLSKRTILLKYSSYKPLHA